MIKIVTFNIRCDYGMDGENNFEYRKDLISRKIYAEQPDILCFQEVLPHVAAWLREVLTDYYAAEKLLCMANRLQSRIAENG